MKILRCIAVGAANSGKTSLLTRLGKNEFSDDYIPTTEFYHDTCQQLSMPLQLWNINTSASANDIANYVKGAHLVYLVIDRSQELEPQFDYLNSILELLPKSEFRFYSLVMTKSDLISRLEPEKYSDLQTKINAYQRNLKTRFGIECDFKITSALSGNGIVGIGSHNLQDSALQKAKILDGNISEYVTPSVHDYAFQDVNRMRLFYGETFRARFSHLSTNPDMDINPDNRAEAITIFNEELSGAGKNIDKISALLKIAEPFINRHRRNTFDLYFRIGNTKSWKTCVAKARAQAVECLQERASQGFISADGLHQWKLHSLFSRHRSNSFLTGAFGNTNAQNELDTLIKKMSRP